jgi:hypothetical protein
VEPNILASIAAGHNVPLADLDKVRAALKAIRDEIRQFDRECKKAEYTDTDEAWDLLYRVRKRAVSALKQLG